jgi:hypothetical protein
MRLFQPKSKDKERGLRSLPKLTRENIKRLERDGRPQGHSGGSSGPAKRHTDALPLREESSRDDAGKGNSDESTASPLPACDRRICPLALLHDKMEQPLSRRTSPDSSKFEVATRAQISPSIYTTLTPWQTRLVEVSNRPTAHGGLQLKVFPVDFVDMEGVGVTGTSQVVRYAALSHVWGSEQSEYPIITCNDKAIAIPRQLYDALMYLATKTTESLVWVDNLCINQSDPIEKARQVRNMLRIFEKADKVIAWLRTDAVVYTKYMLDGERYLGTAHGAKCIEGLVGIETAQQAIVNDSLWSRTWCRQEIFAARRLFLMGVNIDTISMDLVALVNSVTAAKRIQSQLNHSIGTTKMPSAHGASTSSMPANFSAMVQIYQHAGTDDFTYQAPAEKRRYTYHWLHTLRAGTTFQVTDERDRIYAILGMVSSPSTRSYVEHRPDIDLTQLPIDYSKSVSKVYQDLTKYLINTDRNLDCLVVFENRDRRDRPKDLPSWVTDWRYDHPRSLLCLPPKRAQESKTFGQPQIQDLAHTGRLRLEGKILFTVCQLSSYEPVDFRKHQPFPSAELGSFGSAKDLDNHETFVEIQKYYTMCTYREVPKVSENIDFEVWVPRATCLGDFVVLLKGSSFPFILHECSPGEYQLVGPVLYHRFVLPRLWATSEWSIGWFEQVFLTVMFTHWRNFIIV